MKVIVKWDNNNEEEKNIVEAVESMVKLYSSLLRLKLSTDEMELFNKELSDLYKINKSEDFIEVDLNIGNEILKSSIMDSLNLGSLKDLLESQK